MRQKIPRYEIEPRPHHNLMNGPPGEMGAEEVKFHGAYEVGDDEIYETDAEVSRRRG